MEDQELWFVSFQTPLTKSDSLSRRWPPCRGISRDVGCQATLGYVQSDQAVPPAPPTSGQRVQRRKDEGTRHDQLASREGFPPSVTSYLLKTV